MCHGHQGDDRSVSVLGQGVKVRTTGGGPADDPHGGNERDEATRVFTRAPAEPGEGARSVRDDDGDGAGRTDDGHAQTFVRRQDGAHPQTFVRQRPPAPGRRDPGPGNPRPEPLGGDDRADGGGRDDLGDADDADDADASSTRTMRRPVRPRRRRGPRIAGIAALVLVVIVMIPVATWGWVWFTARQDQRPSSDAIVVLGASQYNGQPSPVFEARLRHAADLYEEGVAPAIVTVGGNQPGDNFTEGGSGGRWLEQEGVPSERIVAIGEGSDTLESLELVSLAFRERGWTTAVIVSDPWHSLRSREMAEGFGIEAATSPARSGPAVLERETQLWYITRETASLWHYWIFGESATVRVDAL
ncbi:uncharacterized SAM-binding protein YcdF (DUF218 family) [Actinorugispora endophytica]|uniref:Uncharacterized SAM-binding protein YcdF (DUF218 family) n=2 Tax=Actinorugispora endophytica TaxID=1605990 RepID=A0A4R6UX70_9ACTN|nr:uncharacterized SAM-binding protein YcdF (DUF218 family) [Actinorugispora endophytica]